MDYDSDLEPLFFETRAEVDHVLDHLTERIEAQGYATVANLLNVVGLKSSEVHQHFGWMSTSEFDTIRDKNGLYELHVPNFANLYPTTLDGQA